MKPSGSFKIVEELLQQEIPGPCFNLNLQPPSYCNPAALFRKSEPIVGRSFVALNEKIKHGQKLYVMNCNKCHPGGEAGLAPALNSNPAPGFIKRFQVRHGLGVMPSFNSREVSDADLKEIVAYLKARKKF